MYGHMVRAVGQRFGKDQENYTPSIALNPPYKCHIPELGQCVHYSCQFIKSLFIDLLVEFCIMPTSVV